MLLKAVHSPLSERLSTVLRRFAAGHSLTIITSHAVLFSTGEAVSISLREVRNSAPHLRISVRHLCTSSQEVRISSRHLRTSWREVRISWPEVHTSQRKVRISSRHLRTSHQEVRISRQEVRTSQREVRTSKPEVRTSKQEVRTSLRHGRVIGTARARRCWDGGFYRANHRLFKGKMQLSTGECGGHLAPSALRRVRRMLTGKRPTTE